MWGHGSTRAVRASAFVLSLALTPAPAAADDLAAATWHLFEPGAFNVTTPDRTGFWTDRGERITGSTASVTYRSSRSFPRADGRVPLRSLRPDGPRRGGGIHRRHELRPGPRLLRSARDEPVGAHPARRRRDDAPRVPRGSSLVGANGDILLAGRFEGCVRFAPKAKPVCSDAKALEKYDGSCEGDCTERQPFVATFDSHGKFKSVFAPAGYPALHVAATDGQMAWAGEFTGDLDLDPDPESTVTAAAANARKPGSGPTQAFWSTFDRRAAMRWRAGRAIVGAANARMDDATFDADGTLLLLAHVDPARRKDAPDTLTDGRVTCRAAVRWSVALSRHHDQSIGSVTVDGAVDCRAEAGHHPDPVPYRRGGRCLRYLRRATPTAERRRRATSAAARPLHSSGATRSDDSRGPWPGQGMADPRAERRHPQRGGGRSWACLFRVPAPRPASAARRRPERPRGR